MTSEKIDRFLRKLLMTNNSLISHIYVEDDIIKFEYLSMLNNVACECSLSSNSLEMFIDNSDFINLVRDDEIIIGLVHLEDSLNYLRNLKIDGIHINVNDNNDIFIKIPLDKEIETTSELNKQLNKVDKLLLDCCYKKYLTKGFKSKAI